MTDIDITYVEVEPDVIMIAELPEIPGGGGGGAVDSVNGKTGVVVLNNTDVGAAATVHTHDAGAVVSGTFNVSRIPTGTTGSTVALGNHLHTGIYDPAGSAASAQAAAISAAATDATTKANTAQSNAIATASSDATTKANAAQANAIATAAADATTKADAAELDAITAAAADATSKANAAISAAAAYTDSQNANDVHLTGTQTIAGVKTFSSSPIVPAPSGGTAAINKSYADTGDASSVSTAAADATTKANTAQSNAATYTDGQIATTVKLTGAQTVAGVKTFSSSPEGPDPTTAQQLATKAYVDANGGGTDFFADYWKGVYNNGTTYNLNDVVRSVDGKGMYRCKVATSVGVTPPNYVAGLNQVYYQRTPPPPSHDSDSSPLSIGFRFIPLVNGQVNGIWFYKAASNTGTHVIRLWNDGTNTVVGGPVTVTGETASGWQYMAFSSPVSVTAGTTYTASVDCPNGNYEFHSQFFATGAVTRGQIQGVIGTFGTITARPTSTFGNNFYATDVDFTTATPSPDNWEIMVLAA